MSMRLTAALPLALSVVLLGGSLEWSGPVGSTPGSGAAHASAPAVEPVVRTIVGETSDPPGAPGRRLSLVRYTIAPGAELPPHVHPGVQMAAIVSGTLTYQVVSGAATIQRGVDGAGVPRATEELVGPGRTTLGPGDVVVERGDMVHFGANRTAEPVVILATLITEPGRGLAVPVTLSGR